jgi:uncharacterized damage-inducible protein DinB
MKSINKKQLLSKLAEVVQSQLNEVTEVYQKEHSEVLLKPAVNGGWSIVQCLEHLNTYYNYYLPYIKKAVAKENKITAAETFKNTVIGAYFIQMMDTEAKPKKYKAMAQHVPAIRLNAHSVVAMFIHNQEELLKSLKQAEQIDLNTIRIPTSILKWVKMNLGDVLQFIVVHNERHMQQARRNYISQLKKSA